MRGRRPDNGYQSRGPAAPGIYCAIQPPSTAIGSPVTNDDASEHSHITASAISSGLPIRPTGSAASSVVLPRYQATSWGWSARN